MDVSHLAQLSRLPLTSEEAKKLEQQFQETLQVISKLDEQDTSHISSTFQVTGLKNITREDKIDTSRMFSQEQALQNAKKTHKGYFVVPAIL